MDELKECKYVDDAFYSDIRKVLEKARKRIYQNIQNEMVQAYWPYKSLGLLLSIKALIFIPNSSSFAGVLIVTDLLK